MKKLVVLCLLASTCAFAVTESELQQLATKGDYQAQRNLAYGYIRTKPIDACAWYRVVASSDSPKVNETDSNNDWVYCRKLSLEENDAAWKLVRKIRKSIKR